MLAVAALSLATAHGQVEACAGTLHLADWHDGMDAVDEALIALDGTRSDRILNDIIDEMRCMDELAVPADVGRLARQVSLVAFYAQDPEELTYWALLARETAGGSPWPEGIPVPDRYHEFVADLPTPRVDRLADQSLAPPKKGAILVDGFLVREPVATVGVQHLVQMADKKGRAVSTSWQTGTAFPADWLMAGAAELEIPKWYDEPLPPPPLGGPAVAVADPEPGLVPQAAVEVDPPAVPDVEPQVPAPVVAVGTRPDLQLRFDTDGRNADCEWRNDPKNVEASNRVVAINKWRYPVKTEEEQRSFKKTLRACGEYRAARRFARWQDARGKPLGGARGHRDAMVKALLTREPKRKS